MPQYRPPESFGPIQVIPPGMLGYLGLKTSGENPHSLLGEYRPTIEMRDWLFNQQAQMFQVGFAAGSIGGNLAGTTVNTDSISSVPGTFVVPKGEWWWFHNATITIAPGAGATDFRGLTIGLLCAIGASNAYLNLESSSLVGTNQSWGLSARGFWAPPGASLAWTASIANAAATNAASLVGWLTKLPI